MYQLTHSIDKKINTEEIKDKTQNKRQQKENTNLSIERNIYRNR